MRSIFSGHMSIIRFAALALLALCFVQPQVRAQETTDTVIFPSVGVAPGQSLRLILFNPNGTPVRIQAQIHYEYGPPGGVYVGSGFMNDNRDAFLSFDFRRSDIPLAGEAGTGRVQLRPSVRLTFSEAINPVVASMEIISISDGTSNTILASEVIPSVPSSGGGRDILTGYLSRHRRLISTRSR